MFKIENACHFHLQFGTFVRIWKVLKGIMHFLTDTIDFSLKLNELFYSRQATQLFHNLPQMWSFSNKHFHGNLNFNFFFHWENKCFSFFHFICCHRNLLLQPQVVIRCIYIVLKLLPNNSFGHIPRLN
jgi:hypothetical protein